MSRLIRILLAVLAALPAAAFAAGTGYPLDRAPIDVRDKVQLQNGARLFVNYCLSCHGAQFMRYNRLTEIGLTEQQIRDNLMFTTDKVGETMKVAMNPKDGKQWFGVNPPDLSVIGRARGADWLYTYFRTYYRDPKSGTGWNNAVFANVGMPHALWQLQGERGFEIVRAKDHAGRDRVEYRWTQITPGELSPVEFDIAMRDLTAFLVYMGEPYAVERRRIGVVVLFFLSVLFVFAWALKREFWKDVH